MCNRERRARFAPPVSGDRSIVTSVTGVEGLGRRALAGDTSPRAQALSMDLDHLGMQVTPANVLQVRNALRGEAKRLGDLLHIHDYSLTVRAPAADPVSGPAADLFNQKINMVRHQCEGYVSALQRAGVALEQTARAYGQTEQDIKDSFGAYVDAQQPRWNNQASSRDAMQQLPEPMRSLMVPDQPLPPTEPPLTGLLGGTP